MKRSEQPFFLFVGWEAKPPATTNPQPPERFSFPRHFGELFLNLCGSLASIQAKSGLRKKNPLAPDLTDGQRRWRLFAQQAAFKDLI